MKTISDIIGARVPTDAVEFIDLLIELVAVPERWGKCAFFFDEKGDAVGNQNDAVGCCVSGGMRAIVGRMSGGIETASMQHEVHKAIVQRIDGNSIPGWQDSGEVSHLDMLNVLRQARDDLANAGAEEAV